MIRRNLDASDTCRLLNREEVPVSVVKPAILGVNSCHHPSTLGVVALYSYAVLVTPLCILAALHVVTYHRILVVEGIQPLVVVCVARNAAAIGAFEREQSIGIQFKVGIGLRGNGHSACIFDPPWNIVAVIRSHELAPYVCGKFGSRCLHKHRLLGHFKRPSPSAKFVEPGPFHDIFLARRFKVGIKTFYRNKSFGIVAMVCRVVITKLELGHYGHQFLGPRFHEPTTGPERVVGVGHMTVIVIHIGVVVIHAYVVDGEHIHRPVLLILPGVNPEYCRTAVNCLDALYAVLGLVSSTGGEVARSLVARELKRALYFLFLSALPFNYELRHCRRSRKQQGCCKKYIFLHNNAMENSLFLWNTSFIA